ncbi:START domain-containing protein [Thiomicrorhabdus sp. Milos-T2]|uniref:START domain-containing protein n=1 Tax=Thiomicrorhabdus sp. Milos-T2 TaxID=90814 RepID=UPI000691B521|nr:START domain-containing protein [Thiomicrorhabdus sp. Milos-T2]
MLSNKLLIKPTPIILSLTSLIVCLNSTPVKAWTLEPTDEDSPVQVWTQAVPNSKFKAFKGQVVVNQPLEKTYAVIHDTQNIPKWYHNTPIAKNIKTINKNQSLTYSVTKTPWPVTDRDSVTLVTNKPLKNGGLLIELKAMPNAYPRQEDKIRIPRLEGFWKLIPKNEKQTEVTFQISAEPGGEIPSWLANAMVIDMPFYTLTNLKNRLENQ